MAKEPTNDQAKLKKRISGSLFRYTFAISLAVHFGIWGVVSLPKDMLGKKGDIKMGDGKLKVLTVKKTYDDLPPPPSIEAPTEPTTAPKGLEAKGNVGEIPLPVPDELAEADTISDAVTGVETGVPDGTELIVEDTTEVTGGETPWEEVSFDVEYSEAPVLVNEVKPVYPDLAKESKIEGDVVLFVYIDADGNVRNAVVQSSPGLPALDEAAKKAAMKCKFKPAKQQGVPVGVWYNIVMQFRM